MSFKGSDLNRVQIESELRLQNLLRQWILEKPINAVNLMTVRKPKIATKQPDLLS